MKKIIAASALIILSVFAVSYVLNDKCDTYKKLLNCPQARWEGIVVQIPKDFSYTLDDEGIMIVKSRRVEGQFLAIGKARSNNIEGVEKKFRNADQNILASKTRSVSIGGNRATEVSLLYPNGATIVYITIPDITFLANYHGDINNYPKFYEILKTIKFDTSYTPIKEDLTE